MRSLSPTLMLSCALAATVASTTDARIGGYSHRNNTKLVQTPEITPQYADPAAPPAIHQQLPQQSSPLPAPLMLPVQAATVAQPIASTVSTDRQIQLPPAPAANNIYELMNLLEAQNRQLREQISLLERESNLLANRNRRLTEDRRRLQRKKRRLAERIETLEEQILKAASRPPQLAEVRPSRYSHRAPRHK